MKSSSLDLVGDISWKMICFESPSNVGGDVERIENRAGVFFPFFRATV